MNTLIWCALLRVTIGTAPLPHVLPEYFPSLDVPCCKERGSNHVKSLARKKYELRGSRSPLTVYLRRGTNSRRSDVVKLSSSAQVVPRYDQDAVSFCLHSRRTSFVYLHACMLTWFSALFGVLLHVAMFHSVLGVFGQHTSILCRICPGTAGIGTILGRLSLML